MIKLLALILKNKLKYKKVDDFILPVYDSKEVNLNNVIIASTQIKLQSFKDLEAWLFDLKRIFDEAHENKVDMICFPEFMGLTLFSILKGSNYFLKERVILKNNNQVMDFDVVKIVKEFSFLNDFFIYVMKKFSKSYKMIVSCGTCYVFEEKKVFNKHTLLCDGKVIGINGKIHLVSDEKNIGVSRSNYLSVVETRIGNIGLCVCMDATYYETFKIASKLGADYLITPIGNMEEYNYYLALRGIELRVQESSLIGIKSALVSNKNAKIYFSGIAGIFLPFEYDTSIEAKNYFESFIVFKSIDLLNYRLFKSNIFGFENIGISKKIREFYRRENE